VTGTGNADGVIEFSYAGGAGDGTAPLTWAQRFMWDVFVAAGAEPGAWDFLVVRTLEAPISVETATGMLRRFLLRHPVLRAGVVRAPSEEPRQVVRAADTVSARVVQSSNPASADLRSVIPGTTQTNLCSAALVLDGDLVVVIGMRISHLATDRWGVRLLDQDLAALPVDEQPPDGSSTLSPIDLARFENSPDGHAVERRSLAFAEAVYAVCPPTMWRRGRAPEPTRFWYGELRSSDLRQAVNVLAHRSRLPRVGILAGALGAVAASWAGLDSALLFTISSNRFYRAWRAYPGQMSQEAILHVPMRDTLGETMHAAMVEAMNSLRAARYGPAAMRAVCRAAEAERGCFDKLGSAIVLNLMVEEYSEAVATGSPRPTTFTSMPTRRTGSSSSARVWTPRASRPRRRSGGYGRWSGPSCRPRLVR
jgi:hypothetical protein